MKTPTTRLAKFYELVIDLNIQWQMFDSLYAPTEHYPVFDRTGPNFWNHLQTYLLDALFLSISRFFDPARMRESENPSLRAVISFDEVNPIRDELSAREADMRLIWERGIKIWRHKRLSHSDMNTALRIDTLPDVPFADIKDIVERISQFAREINHRIHEYDQSYKVSIVQWTPQIMDYLRHGIERKDEQLNAYRNQKGA
jgi:hypothetical protein